ncbi:FecR family protein [Carboxylicivirga sp. RSCT41]|uniref:FecR family protein n=1 Tax=Carboxylicivirga agarovorans TaxID=3417570 RepID=UPI003D324B33
MERIIEKYLNGIATKGEQDILLSFVRKDDLNLQFFQKKKTEWKSKEMEMLPLSTMNAWRAIENQVQCSPKNRFIWIKPVLAIASIVLIGLLLSTYLFIFKPENVLTVQTVKGQTIEVVLPDSTVVHLNANSSISYNPILFSFKRSADMTGEAFFDVRKKSSKDFLLNVNDLNVRVLGTRFNVNAYKAEQSIDVVLEEGSIEITMDDVPDFIKILEPGQRASVNMNQQKLSLSHVRTENYSSWKDGILHFKNSNLFDFFTSLEQRYGVVIAVEDNEVLRNLNISLTIENDRLDDVLDVVQLSLPVKIKTENNIFKVTLDKTRYKSIKYKK